jgi:hypothetical protein
MANLFAKKIEACGIIYILAFIIVLGVVMLSIHYLFGHHIIRNLRRAINIVKSEDLS